jgi:hypothetical protein
MPDPVTSRRKLPEMDWSDPEQVREYQRLYQERNRERIVQQKHAYYLRNRDKSLRERREYVQRNRETIKARKADYYQRNKDAIKQRAAAYRAQNPGKNRETILRSHHGMRPEDWDALWAAQDGRCYLCGDELNPGPGRHVHIEHDHSCCPLFRSCSTCRRGLACKRCNSAIGLADDDPGRLRRMADALEAAQLAVEQRKAAADSLTC